MTQKPDLSWLRIVLTAFGLMLAMGASWLLMSDRVARAEEKICQMKEHQKKHCDMFESIDGKLDTIILKLEIHLSKHDKLVRRGEEGR